MRRIERQGADGLRRLLVEDRPERRAAVGGFPHAAGRRADQQHGLAIGLDPPGDRGDPAAHGGRADVASAKSRDGCGVEGRDRGRLGDRGGGREAGCQGEQ